jgi:hypothetical protein
MSPIIGARGGLSASAYGLFTGAVAEINSYESIATINGTGSSGTISFTSIPSTYNHLQIRWIGKSTSTGTYTILTFNGDSANNYVTHSLFGNGSVASAENYPNNSSMSGGFLTTSSQTGFGSAVLDILDYKNTSKNTTLRGLTGRDNNGSGTAAILSGLWRNTTTVNRIDITVDSSSSWSTTSSFALYGIKG